MSLQMFSAPFRAFLPAVVLVGILVVGEARSAFADRDELAMLAVSGDQQTVMQSSKEVATFAPLVARVVLPRSGMRAASFSVRCTPPSGARCSLGQDVPATVDTAPNSYTRARYVFHLTNGVSERVVTNHFRRQSNARVQFA